MDYPRNPVDLLLAMPAPEKVRALEDALLQLPQIDLQTTHAFAGGLYARTILIPAGTVLTGALTTCDNLSVVYGDITVTTDEGVRRLGGYNVLPAKSGAKRAGVAHADTYWTTVFRTDATTVGDAEDALTSEASRLQTRREGIDFARTPALEGEQ